MCFSLGWFETICIYFVFICAIIAAIRLLLPVLAGMLPAPASGVVVGIINIICWVIVAVLCIYIIFGLLSCLVGGGGGGISFMPHR